MTHPGVIVIRGGEVGRKLALTEVLADFTLGSDDGCHLVFKLRRVSPVHASLFLDDEGHVILTDAHSATGVFVNGRKVTEHTLKEREEISLGPPGDQGSALLRFTARMAVEEPALPQELSDLVPEAAAEPLLELAPPAAPPAALSVEDLFAPAPAELMPELQATPPSFFEEPTPSLPSAPAFSPVPEPAAPAFAPITEPAAPAFAPLEPAFAPEALPEGDPDAPAQPMSLEPEAGLEIEPDHAPAPGVAKGEDDPLSGLAESLGGSSDEDDRFVPPPVEETPEEQAAARRRVLTGQALVIARLAAITAVIVAGAWYAYNRYMSTIVLPVIDTYLPNPAEPGQTVTINGSGFGTDPDPTVVSVTVGGTEVPVLDAVPTRVNFTVPEALGAGGSRTLSLKVEARGYTSTSRLLRITVTPKITALAPKVGLAGDEITISGRWLASDKAKPLVTVAGTDAEVLEASTSSVRIRVPSLAAAEGSRVPVKVAVGNEVSKEALLNYGRLPFVETVTPARALPGEPVTLTGIGFGADATVTIGGRAAVILSAAESKVEFSMPGLRLTEGAGQKPMVSQAAGRMSIPRPIEVLRESDAAYAPRFFAEVMKDGRFAVSCELGPWMVLGADAGSAKRAHATAGRLNALLKDARTTRVLFTASDGVISAAGGPVLTVSSGDASVSSGSDNLRLLANLWAAHLSDTFDLFLQGRRPGRSIELSPAGRVYLDIFAAAKRRSNAKGVPPGVLFTLDPAWVASLSSIAGAPVFADTDALVVLDGSWSGDIEIPGAIQPRRIEISLTSTPAGVTGQKTSRQGVLSTDMSLQAVSFVRKELRFQFVDSGEDLVFRGALDGDTIDGTVTKTSGEKVGRLLLKLAR